MSNSNKYDRPVDELQEALENQIRDNTLNLFLKSISKKRNKEFESKGQAIIISTPNSPNSFIQQYFQEQHNKHFKPTIIKNVYDSVNISEESLFQLFDSLALSREFKSDFVTYLAERFQKEKSDVPVIVIDSFCDFEPMKPFNDNTDSIRTGGTNTSDIFKIENFTEAIPVQTDDSEEPINKKAQFKQTPLERLNKKTDKPKLSKFFKNGI